MQRVFTQEYDQIVRRERAVLDDLRVQIAKVEASDEDLTLLKTSLNQLDEFFLLVVVGEFNAGKTAFLNALLGGKFLTEGVTPTTNEIHLIRYADTMREERGEIDYRILYMPVEWLREISLVDTPGTNAIIQRHQEITEHFVPRSDLVLFVTSADRPFSESERGFLERIRKWGKKVVIIINKIDLYDDEKDRREVINFVRENATQLLGSEPEIFAVSAKLAQQAKAAAKTSGGTPNGATWDASNFDPLERYIIDTLDITQRTRLKLENPLGVATRLIDKYKAIIQNREDLLKGDFQTLDAIESHISSYESDMRRDFKFQSSRVDNVLYEMAERGDKFFDETMRIARVFDLMNTEKLRGDFEREVVGDTSRRVEQHVQALIDWIIDKDHRQWRDIMDFLNRRASQHTDKMVGQVGSNFEFNRQSLLTSVGYNAQQVVDSYDHTAESLKLADEVRRALMATAAVEVGALGLGALLVTLLHGALLDFTGILGAGAVAALGFYVLPYRRQQLKNDLRERINELRGQLDSAISKEFEQELASSIQRLRDGIMPYTRFVRIEREKMEKLASQLNGSSQELNLLRGSLKNLTFGKS
ncbi:MAG: dynamin family protein [Caldilineaceae bacterium]